MYKRFPWILIALMAIRCRADVIGASVAISSKEMMVIPHDRRLDFDIESESESRNGSWIRLRAKDPEGIVSQVFRIQLMDDPGGILATAEVGVAGVRAVAAPYLSGSLEKRCNVLEIKKAMGNVYYCILTNAGWSNGPMSPPDQYRYLFLGIFKIGGSVAFVTGGFNQMDSANFRMMMETLGNIATLPIVGGPPGTAPQ
jgi:hypothetical protein